MLRLNNIATINSCERRHKNYVSESNKFSSLARIKGDN